MRVPPSTRSVSHPRFRPPVQGRSRETLERIVGAALELLDRGGPSEFTVDGILARAGVSKGSFYARFDDLDALVDHVADRMFDDALDSWRTFLDPGRWRGEALEEFARALVERLSEIYATAPRLHRALALLTRSDPDSRFAQRAAALNTDITRMVVELQKGLTDWAGERPGSGRVDLALVAISATARECLLFPDLHPHGVRDGIEDYLARVLVNAMR